MSGIWLKFGFKLLKDMVLEFPKMLCLKFPFGNFKVLYFYINSLPHSYLFTRFSFSVALFMHVHMFVHHALETPLDFFVVVMEIIYFRKVLYI